MYDANLIPLSCCALAQNPHQSIAIYKAEVIDKTRFNSDVKKLSGALASLDADCFALYSEQAYLFTVYLYALLHSGKKVWIPGNNKSATINKLTEQGCLLLGEWQGKEITVKQNQTELIELKALDKQTELIIFTSGSSGQPKAISKTLQQLQLEIETLEAKWGESLGQSSVLATVSHQHIYGLLFRVLWPLAAGRCFYSDMYLSPEPLLKLAKDNKAYWVASPAQLKRLDDLTAWQDLKQLKAIFSSGGALSFDAASLIHQHCQHKVIEVYGSSETGGIAWRQQIEDSLWMPFDGIKITVDERQKAYLSSPYLTEQLPYSLDDKIKLYDAGGFALLGRVDRIVKIEEKRLSLDELEQYLTSSDWVQQAHCLLLTAKRDKIATVLILTESGRDYLQQQGRSELIKQLRKQLMQAFETVVLPRKWLIMQSLPLTTQGKVNTEQLMQLFALDNIRFP